MRNRRAVESLASLRFRLPVWITGLVVLVLATFLWTAYRRVVDVSVRTVGARAQQAAEYIAPVVAQLRSTNPFSTSSDSSDFTRNVKSEGTAWCP